MKKVLLATSAMMMVGGVAMADVSVGGDGRMGIISPFGADAVIDPGVDGVLGTADDVLISAAVSDDMAFTSRIRISFSASGETDGGLSFGGSIRADNSGGGASGTAGSVFVEGSFGKLSMGDVSGAAEAAVGDVSGVGLTGLSDFNETTYLSNNTGLLPGTRPGALYEYSAGDLTFYASAGNPGNGEDAFGVGVAYGMGNFTVALGYEDVDDGLGNSADHTVVGATGTFGDATVKVVYGDSSDLDVTQTGVSLDYVMGATTATVFYRTVDAGAAGDVDGFGIGVAYDLGGGASLKAGYVDIDDGSDATDDDAFDFGLSMSF